METYTTVAWLVLALAGLASGSSRSADIRGRGMVLFEDPELVPSHGRSLKNRQSVQVAATSVPLVGGGNGWPMPLSDHYAEYGEGMFMNTGSGEGPIAVQSNSNCTCLKTEERCIQLEFKCREKQCIRAQMQCEKIDTVCTQYVQRCQESSCVDWTRQCTEEISTCVEIHYDPLLGTTCLRQETQCLKWGFSCTNTVCSKQGYDCVKRASPICTNFKMKCINEMCAQMEVTCKTPEKHCVEYEPGCQP
ncbi:hypothetical protein BSKO_04625 [Bryopsis sp. KO-2023]|nr:hypothetical protein BSKO_04625 [Bryopsis sp. KO-2023]